jgi:hypothetical protein
MVSLYTGRLPNLTLDDIAMPEPCIPSAALVGNSDILSMIAHAQLSIIIGQVLREL